METKRFDHNPEEGEGYTSVVEQTKSLKSKCKDVLYVSFIILSKVVILVSVFLAAYFIFLAIAG